MGKKKNKLSKYAVNPNERVPILIGDLRKIEDELQHLKVVDRKAVARRIKSARELGNLAENPEYDAAKDEQRGIERRIEELERKLAFSVVVDEDTMEVTQVCVGSSVRIHDLEYNEWLEYKIVPTEEANSLKGKISNESPIGKALMGAKEGDTLSVDFNGNKSNYKVLKILGFDEKYRSLIKVQKKNQLSEKEVQTVKPDDKRPIKEITPKHFLTRVNVFKCTSEKHVLIDIFCKVKVIKRNGVLEEVMVPGAYCENCDKYFLLESQYAQLKERGVILCKVVENNYWISQGNSGYAGLNNESLLHMMGYNVNAQAALSKQQRWGVLEIAVDEHILSSAEITSHLQWLIRRSSHLKNFSDARDKWSEDMEHIQTYSPRKRTGVEASSITVNRYHKK